MHSDVHVACDRLRGSSYAVPCLALMGVSLVTGCILLTAAFTAPNGYSDDEAGLQVTTASDELSYGIIVDAGSSGSRVYLYCWPAHTTDDRQLIKLAPVRDATGAQVSLKVSPGLSSFADAPANATDYLRPLLDYVLPYVPLQSRASTPLFVLATAGMRLLDLASQQAILTQLRRWLPDHYPFQVVDSHIDVISGKWEGVYSWIAVNYILGSFDHVGHHYFEQPAPLTEQSHVDPDEDAKAAEQYERAPTVGMIDMGGASVQIAFEYTAKVPKSQSRLFERVNLGCEEHDTQHEYQLYVVTFLGYGANEALERYELVLLAEALANHTNNIAAGQSSVRSTAVVVSDETSPPPPYSSSSSNASHHILSNETSVVADLGPEEIPRPPVDIGDKISAAQRKRRRRKRAAAKSLTTKQTADVDNLLYIRDPCLPVNHFLRSDVPPAFVALHAAVLGAGTKWTLVRRGVGRFDECTRVLRPLLAVGNASCELAPCSMNGVHQPAVDWRTQKIYAFSEYWYSMYDILGLGGYYDYYEYTKRAAEFCATKWSEIQHKFQHNLYPRADRDRLNTQCAKAAWITLVLHEGFGVPKQGHQFRSAQRINDQEVQWTMGALLHKMRYFPLRDRERRRLEAEQQERVSRLRPAGGGLTPAVLLLLTVCLCVLLLLLKQYWLRCGRALRVAPNGIGKRRDSIGRKQQLPRNRSIWGYMMTSAGQDDTDRLLSGVRVETADYVY